MTVDVAARINDAWKHIESKCAKSKECNAYFAKLRRGRTLEKKSQAHVSSRWLRMNVVHRCPRWRFKPAGRYLATVRGETR
jgi:hypothetical protein